jgi:cell cycle serine/threonine-protein kinase CDC5/MSD2
VVKFLDYYEDDTSVYIVLELCPNKTLNDLIKSKKRLSEHRAMFYLMDLVE